MKPQDILLLVIFIGLLIKNNKNWTTVAGLLLVALSIPLFAKYIFFTAEHFVYFAALYFFLAAAQVMFGMIKGRRS